jgi:tuberculosinol/isotuberculosinol synthase
VDWQAFQELPSTEVAQLVSTAGSGVCTFAVDGTRRWYLLEHPEAADSSSLHHFLGATWRRQHEIYQLLFEHGLETVLVPLTVPHLLQRDERYLQLLEPGFLWFCQNEEMVAFYQRYDVRVRVYGDAARFFAGTPYLHLLDNFEAITRQTAAHQRYRLFFGIQTYDPVAYIAELGVQFYQEHGRLPDKQEIVERYYGEYVPPVALYIGSDRPAIFDFPVNPTGLEDLYFMVRPSLYLDQTILRAILYDHLFMRPVSALYSGLPPSARQAMTDFYRLNQGRVLGIGRQHPSGAFWYPTNEQPD